MKLYTYRTMPVEWRDTGCWPVADTSQLDEDAVARFERLATGIGQYLRTGKLGASAKDAQCSPNVLIKQLNRCLTPTMDGQLVGWRGLIERLRLNGYHRSRQLPSGKRDAESGAAGSFGKFLAENPEIKGPLDRMILTGSRRRHVRSVKPTFRSAAAFFRELCREHFRDDQYPLNSRSQGRRSVERYARALIATSPAAAAIWYRSDATQRLRLGTGEFAFPLAVAPFDVTGIDAHKIDATGIVVIPGPTGPQRVPIERIWIYGYVDSRSRSALGYAVAIRTEPAAVHLERAVVCSTRAWQPRKLRVVDITYMEGAGLPCGVIEGLSECRPAAIVMDNALQHYANRVSDTLRRRLGCALNWGPVGAWWHNAIAERLFRTLELYGFQRLPSSTGTGPSDPRRPDSVRQAIKHAIEWDELLDIIDVLICNYNATPNSSLGNQAPLQVLRNWVESGALLPCLIPPTVLTPRLGITVETHPARGSMRVGKVKSLYVQVDGVQYSSPTFAKRFELINQPVVLHIEEDDLRTIVAYLPSGEPLGTLVALHRGWRQVQHSRDMRKQINRLIRTHELPRGSLDPVEDYMRYLAKKAVNEAHKRPEKISHAATVLAAAAATSGVPIPSVAAERSAGRPRAVPPSAMPDHVQRPVWRSPDPRRLP